VHFRRSIARVLLLVALGAVLFPGAPVLATDPEVDVAVEAPAWIVQLNPGWAQFNRWSGVDAALGDSEVTTLTGVPRAFVARFDGQTSASDAIARLASSPAVAHIEPDIVYQYQFSPNDPLLVQQYWANTVNLREAWGIAGGDPSMIVAVIDSGVRGNHPDLIGRLVPGYNFVDDNDNTTDVIGHGTSVAGIAAAAGNNGIGVAGAALDVRIMPIKVGTAEGARVSLIAQGIVYAVDNGARVINLSLGSPSDSALLQNALQYATSRNVMVVAAAGNTSNAVSFPASYPEAISVGATTLDGTELAGFSSRISRVDLVAPGVDVLTTFWSPTDGNTYAWRAGTSFAAPIVAGTVALALSVNPTLTVEDVREILTSTTQFGFEPGTPGTGAGLLDAGAAVQRTLLPSIGATWLPADLPVASHVSRRTWLWGPHAFHIGTEQYADAEHDRRLVAYYDKSRMEITNPYGDRSSVWYVTNGLLVNEMISGDVQVGDALFEHIGPAQVPVAGDPDDQTGPYYASFFELRDSPAQPPEAVLIQTVDRSGAVGADDRLAAYGVTAAEHVPATGHRVASVFWIYLNSTGPIFSNGAYQDARIFNPTFYATGFPVTPALWSRVSVAGEVQDVLIQCFERRCLTYTPSNPTDWQVEMGNVGLHYYRWRFGVEPGGPVTLDPSALALSSIQ
jgi:thermitase